VGRLDRAEPVEAVVKRVTAFLLLASACWSVGAAHAQRSTSIKDLRKHFADCFQPPQPLNGSRLTFYFSLTSKGQIIGGGPKTVWFGLRANQSDRARLLNCNPRKVTNVERGRQQDSLQQDAGISGHVGKRQTSDGDHRHT
jgi:hypothetical protein